MYFDNLLFKIIYSNGDCTLTHKKMVTACLITVSAPEHIINYSDCISELVQNKYKKSGDCIWNIIAKICVSVGI